MVRILYSRTIPGLLKGDRNVNIIFKRFEEVAFPREKEHHKNVSLSICWLFVMIRLLVCWRRAESYKLTNTGRWLVCEGLSAKARITG